MTWAATARLIRDIMDDVGESRPSDYRDGYEAALHDLLEAVKNEMWEAGEDEEDDDG